MRLWYLKSAIKHILPWPYYAMRGWKLHKMGAVIAFRLNMKSALSRSKDAGTS